ncbi:MAG: CotH kinase family protein [Melioribacteraceae bacterium]
MKLMPTFILSTIFFVFSVVANAQTNGVLINEILASNVATNKSPVYSEYADWIELANTTTTSIDLSGYYLSDDLKNKTKWKIPANTIIPASGYIIFWADDRNTGLHTNFKLSRDGESVGLFNSSGAVVDTITFGYQYDDVSYGRFSNDNSKWGYFKPPTPSAKNISSGEIAIAPVPVFSISGGYYKNGQTLTLSSPNSNAEIRYTLNGTEPTKSSLLYTVPLKIDSTISIRARAYEIGKTQSLIATNTYLINEQNNLPVVSLVTDPANLFDDKIGIYVTGTNGIRGSCDATIRNLNQDWERPVNIELFEPSGERVINQGAGIKIFGGCSRTRYPQKSFALFARSEYGKGSFEYKLFPDKQITKFESFILRSSSDDQVYTMFRDALAHLVMKDQMDAETQAYRPAVVFINGAYWGIHNIREKVNENFLAGNFGVNPDDVNILESNAGVVYGTNAGYTNMVNYATNYNMAVQSNFEYMKSWMDIDQYIDYQIGHIYLAERDWPGNNIKYWRANSGTYSRWRWINFDLDQTFTFIWITENMIEKTTTTTGPGWPNPEWSTRLFRNLLKNENFKNDFIQRYAYHANTTFKPERLIHFIDSLSANIAPEIPRHIKRWGGKIDPDSHEGWTPKAIFKSYQEWLGNVDTMRIFSLRRPQYSTAHILQKFGLSGVSKIDVKMNSTGKGILKVVDRQIPNNFSGTFYNDIPLRLSAVPMFGSKFSYWEVEGSTNQINSLIPSSSEWKYYDHGVDLKTSWYQSGYDDSKWLSGNAQLGYGDSDETTVVGYGPNSSNRYITTYFRKTFSITDKSSIASLSFEILADDGAVVYLNDSEV